MKSKRPDIIDAMETISFHLQHNIKYRQAWIKLIRDCIKMEYCRSFSKTSFDDILILAAERIVRAITDKKKL